jgi:cell division protein FtsB
MSGYYRVKKSEWHKNEEQLLEVYTILEGLKAENKFLKRENDNLQKQNMELIKSLKPKTIIEAA